MSISLFTRRRGYNHLPPRKSDICFHSRPTDRSACGNNNVGNIGYSIHAYYIEIDLS